MNCRETRPLLSLFFDGELEGRQMRAVALHSTRCPQCEEELRKLERLQDVVVSNVAALVDEIDLSRVWTGVMPRLEAARPQWYRRVRDWWGDVEFGRVVHWPAYAAVAVVTLLAMAIWQGGEETIRRNVALEERRVDEVERKVIAAVGNSAIVDSIIGSVAVMTEPETGTTVLLINDAGGLR